MKNKLQHLKQEILAQLTDLADAAGLESLEKKYLGKKGELTLAFKKIKDLPADERKETGGLAQEVRRDIEGAFAQARERLVGGEEAGAFFDVTLPGVPVESGHLHQLTLVQRDLERIFSSMGFMILEGPELESDYYNFEALNIPPTHPARDMQDTFYIKDHKNWVMRTHTSPVQVRALQKYGAP